MAKGNGATAKRAIIITSNYFREWGQCNWRFLFSSSLTTFIPSQSTSNLLSVLAGFSGINIIVTAEKLLCSLSLLFFTLTLSEKAIIIISLPQQQWETHLWQCSSAHFPCDDSVHKHTEFISRFGTKWMGEYIKRPLGRVVGEAGSTQRQ